MKASEMKTELIPVLKRMPVYLKLAWALYKEPALSKSQKRLLAAGVLYTVSPLDLVPGFIPVVGQLDDILVGLGSLKRALKALPPDILATYEKKFEITLRDVEEDLKVTKKISLSVLGKTMKYSAKGLYAVGRVGLNFMTKLVCKTKQ